MMMCKRLQIASAVATYLMVTLGFSLSAYAKLEVKNVSGGMREEGISWTIGRSRGLAR
jgi:hypothetical protein